MAREEKDILSQKKELAEEKALKLEQSKEKMGEDLRKFFQQKLEEKEQEMQEVLKQKE